MKKNVGRIDRIFRLIAGLVLVVISSLLGVSGTLAIVLMILGILLLITGTSSFCPVYQLLGMKTSKN